jgi:GT2 family glycosyltransferase
MISIVIPVFNQHEMTRECITAIRENTTDCEIIIVDNGSNHPVANIYTGFIPLKVIRNEENRGFPAAVNQGIEEASGDILILLNNDVIVTKGWAEILVNALDEYSIVGPTTNYCAGMQRVLASPYENMDELNDVAHEISEDYQDHVQEVKWIIGFCMAIHKSVFDEVGGFDESLWPCSGEEIDFCMRARQAGHKVGIARGCYVHHEGSVTFKAMMDDAEYSEICKRNDDHLAERWGADFSKQAIDASPSPRGISLNLGCGYKKLNGYVNIDNRDEVNPDLVCDVTTGLPYEDNSVDMVRAFDFLEHISPENVIDVMNDIWRVLKPDGIFESSTPSTDGRGAFQDPTHRSFWNRNSWLYYSDAIHRGLYGIKADFNIESITENEPHPAWMIIHTHVIAKARK